MTGIDDLARQIGEFRWVEEILFETLGAWALDGDTPTDPLDRVTWASGSHRAAWRMEQLEHRAPVLAHLAPGTAVQPPGPPLGPAIERLQAAAGPADRNSAYREIVTLLDQSYTAALRAANPHADRPSVRLYTRICADVADTLGDDLRPA
jgi:hypothetical protein